MDPTAVTAPPARRNNSWSLRQIVRDVSGQSLEAFQDPSLTPHPYVTYVTTGRVPEDRHALPREDEYDPPVAPRPRAPLPPVRAETPAPPRVTAPPPAPPRPEPLLDTRAPEHVEFPLEVEDLSREAPHASSYRRPERIYLHQLLLHLDRLDENALRHLQSEVNEELEHRSETRHHGSERS
ncbi:MAG: hypothetical protein L3K03_03125 [Thermoplasmata archaeon]|nr:hypothetical protein [Thermoplasmata archaeon]